MTRLVKRKAEKRTTVISMFRSIQNLVKSSMATRDLPKNKRERDLLGGQTNPTDGNEEDQQERL